MTTEELNELSKGDGIILAYKEGDSIYPIFLDREDANLLVVLDMVLNESNKKIQVLRSVENEYRKVEE